MLKKKLITLLAVAGLVLALAPAAQAAVITPPDGGYPALYRLAFVTTGKTAAASTDIADYNAFVTAAAAAVTEVNDLGATWKVIGSTAAVSAKVNTGTLLTGDAGYIAVNDVPIYNLDGLLLSMNNAQLWDGAIDNFMTYVDGSPLVEHADGWGPNAWTGTNNDGTPGTGDGGPFGTIPYPKIGNTMAGHRTWLAGASQTYTDQNPLYGLSAPISAVMLSWQGGSGVWDNATTDNWTTTYGTAEDLPPAAYVPMTIDAVHAVGDTTPTAASVVTVDADFIDGGTGPAGAITIGEIADATYGAELIVSSGFTLEAGAVVVEQYGKLSGGGTLVSSGVEVYGTLAPGNGVGTLSITGNMETFTGFKYEWEIGAAATDLIDVTGSLDLDDFELEIIDVGADGSIAGDIALFNYSSGTVDIPTTPVIDASGLNADVWDTSSLSLTDDGSTVFLSGMNWIGLNVREWNVDSGGFMNVDANWDGGDSPNGGRAVITFGDALTGTDTTASANTDSAMTVKDITFDNPNRYVVGGAGSITLEDTFDEGPDVVSSTVTVSQGTHEFIVPVTLGNDATVDVNVDSELIFNNALNLGGNTLTKDGPGLLTINNGNIGTGTLHVADGTIGGHGAVSGNLTVTGTVAPGNSIGTLTVGQDAAIATGGVLRCEIQGTEGNGDKLEVIGNLSIAGADSIKIDWLPGDGYDSMFADTFRVAEYSGSALADFGESANDGANIGGVYIKNVEYAVPTTDGFAIEVELYDQVDGDFNLDGTVGAGDLTLLSLAWGQTSDISYLDGDFNFDGEVGAGDLTLLGTAWGQTVDLTTGTQIGVVPEPGTFLMLLIGMAGLLIYRKRR